MNILFSEEEKSNIQKFKNGKIALVCNDNYIFFFDGNCYLYFRNSETIRILGEEIDNYLYYAIFYSRINYDSSFHNRNMEDLIDNIKNKKNSYLEIEEQRYYVTKDNNIFDQNYKKITIENLFSIIIDNGIYLDNLETYLKNF